MRFVELDGTYIADDFEFQEGGENVPEDLAEELQEEKYDAQEIQVPVSIRYRRTSTGVILWPSSSTFAIRHNNKDIPSLCETILTWSAETPREDGKPIVDFLFYRCSEDPGRILQAIWHASVVDIKTSFDVQKITEVLVKFGFGSIRSALDVIIDHSQDKSI
ncbi:hypothetical protein BXZ70DRAFT_1009713 [Cristinia sonorae]|uniref:Uncharacterized protein n=1 Tax=Cristinia sonorae TaxID=1940300 RepID=A0A8K0UKE2_9AGAR|nr:hypothetical protein BXZ70DRAFT_1009713 [Cristinia sonorae]